MSGDTTTEREETWYFEIQARLGFTKHLGGEKATRELAELCQVGEETTILNVGCGAGISACYLAKTYGCRVIGVDISERMLAQAQARAARQGVVDRVDFGVGDAQNLAFGENSFDTVICESVNTFVANKAQAFSEYAWVIKPGGYVGLNETIWLRPPAPGVARDFTQLAGEEVLTSADWEALLADSGLRDLVVRTYEISLGSEAINHIRLIGLKEYLRVLYKLGVLYFMESGGRRYLKEALSIPRETMDYIGYGLYVGRKL